MLISNMKISDNSYQFLPELLTEQLAGKTHKATYKRFVTHNGSYPTPSLPKGYEITKGNVLYFGETLTEEQFIYADHLWRVCRLLDHNRPATLTITDKGIEITQPKQRVLLKWLTSYTSLDITLIRWY